MMLFTVKVHALLCSGGPLRDLMPHASLSMCRCACLSVSIGTHSRAVVQVGEGTLLTYLDKWDRKYWATYKVLDILQKVFYRSNPAREAFVEMCKSDYVQKMTFDSYLYKTVVPGNPLDDVKLLVETVGSIVRSNALRAGGKGLSMSFGSKADAERMTV